MSTVVPVTRIEPEPESITPVDPAPPRHKKDKWDKAEIILKPLGGLLTAIAIASIGFLGSSYFEKKDAVETNLRLYTELMNKREEAENTLRTDMFGKIFQTFLTPPSSGMGAEHDLQRINDEILSIELIARNFHEFLDIKPLFLDVLRSIIQVERQLRPGGAGESDEARKIAGRLRHAERKKQQLINVARRITSKQLVVLEEAGSTMTLRVPFDQVCTDKNIRTFQSDDHCDQPGVMNITKMKLQKMQNKSRLTSPEREFTVYVERAYPAWKMARVRVTAIEQGVAGATVPDVDERTFWVGAFDFPMVDNTYLSPDERYTVVIDDFDEDSIVVKLIYFPASFAGLREKSYYHQKVVQHLIDRSDFFQIAQAQ